MKNFIVAYISVQSLAKYSAKAHSNNLKASHCYKILRSTIKYEYYIWLLPGVKKSACKYHLTNVKRGHEKTVGLALWSGKGGLEIPLYLFIHACRNPKVLPCY